MQYYVSDDYLMHHGVKGMKWGVRKTPYTTFSKTDRKLRYPGRYRRILKYGWKQGHGMNVNDRINEVKSNKARMDRMSSDQKQSLNKASKYWSNRAKGQGYRQSGKRNIIKRTHDDYRSFSIGRRSAATLLSSAGSLSAKNIAASAPAAAGSLAFDELINKGFGHF